jgi:hypothetical protein
MMQDWRKLAAAGDYAKIRELDLDPPDQAAYLAHLREKVPLRDGRHLLPGEIDGSDPAAEGLRIAAMILARGELAAAVEFPDDVPPYAELWPGMVAEIRGAIAPLADDHQPCGPNDPPATHVARVHSALDQLALLERHYIGTEDDPDRRRMIAEAIAEAAMMGFLAGQHTQIALHAPFYQAQAGSLAPVMAAQDEALHARLAADAVIADRDAAVASQSALAARNADLESTVIDIGFARRKGGAVRQDKAKVWQELAIATFNDCMEQSPPGTLKEVVNLVELALQKAGSQAARGTIENLLRSPFRSRRHKNPRS